jgi:endonuclease YncB( thermonuclease family)
MLTVLVVVLAPALVDTLTGKAVKVADGDAITVLDNTNTQYRIRL